MKSQPWSRKYRVNFYIFLFEAGLGREVKVEMTSSSLSDFHIEMFNKRREKKRDSNSPWFCYK